MSSCERNLAHSRGIRRGGSGAERCARAIHPGPVNLNREKLVFVGGTIKIEKVCDGSRDIRVGATLASSAASLTDSATRARKAEKPSEAKGDGGGRK